MCFVSIVDVWSAVKAKDLSMWRYFLFEKNMTDCSGPKWVLKADLTTKDTSTKKNTCHDSIVTNLQPKIRDNQVSKYE